MPTTERSRQGEGGRRRHLQRAHVRILHRNSATDINRGQIMRYNLEQTGLKVKTEVVP